MTGDEDQPWEILRPLRCTDRSTPLTAFREGGLPSCEQGELSHCGLQKDLHVSFNGGSKIQTEEKNPDELFLSFIVTNNALLLIRT